MSGETYAVVGYASQTHFDIAPTLGKDWIVDVTVKDGNGNVVDVTSATCKWRVAAASSSTSPLMLRTVGTGITITNGTAGTLRCAASATNQTAAGLVAGTRYRHELEVTTTGSVVYESFHGYLTPTPGLSG